MKPVVIGALSLLIIGASSWLLLEREPVNKPHSTDVTIAKSAGTSATVELTREDSIPSAVTSDVIKLRQSIDELTVELKQIVDERSNAEELLRQAERDVASLERFIEEIEERGEDPVDYVDEGLALYQPAFNAYQDAFDKLELAETMEQIATEELAAAENELANILFD